MGVKRFLLFAGEDYYPAGGWLDLRGSYASVGAAKRARPRRDVEWAQVVDLETGGVVVVWDKFVGLWGTSDEVEAAVDAKLVRRRRAGYGFAASSAAFSTAFPVMGQSHQ